MYGAMREHAPQSTRFAGAIAATAITLAAGYALANGLGGYIANALPDPIVFVPLQEETKPTPPPPTAETLDTRSEANLMAVDPLFTPTDWEIERTIIVSQDPIIPRSNPGPATPQPPTPKSVRVAPKILPAAPPPYPASEVRKNNQGITQLSVCLDTRGRVTSASLAETSGHPVLDQAALKWVRTLKFTPLTIDGAPQSICNHAVDYEWQLNRR